MEVETQAGEERLGVENQAGEERLREFLLTFWPAIALSLSFATFRKEECRDR